ncbi:MAG TPA: hypothetical protein VGC99_27375, partial [Candidatus Tectomicrobia bacterium]
RRSSEILLWLGAIPSYEMSYDSTAPCHEASGTARAPHEQQWRWPAISRTALMATDCCASTRSFTTPSVRHPAWGVVSR